MKRQAAWLLVVALIISCLPNVTFANGQIASNEKTISKITVRSNKTGNSIEPNVIVEWHGVSNGSDDTEDKTLFYDYEVTDVTSGTKIPGNRVLATGDNSNENDQNYSVNLSDLPSKNFTNGKLFKIEIIPGHQHTDDGVKKDVLANGNKGIGYFITDLDTKVENIDGQLCVTFDYIKGASYTGKYIAASRSTLQEVEEGVDTDGTKIDPVPFTVSEADAQKAENRYNGRVKYVIQDAVPGQVYSAYVKVNDVAESVVSNFSFDRIAQNMNTGTDGPKVGIGVKQINLTGQELEPDLIELKWNVGSWAGIQGVLKQTKVYITDKDGNLIENINTINNENLGSDLTSTLYKRPTEITYFKVVLELAGIGEASSNVYRYIPNVSVDKPLKPQVPKPLYKDMQVDSQKLYNYKVSKYDNIELNDEFRKNAFTVNSDPLSIQLVWDAPMVNSESGSQVDYDLKYDIYISDQNNFEGLKPTYPSVSINGKNKDELVINSNAVTVVGFKKKLSEYTNKEGGINSIQPNKTYYIKIVAKRLYGNENDDEFFYSEPTIVNITTQVTDPIYNPQSLSKPPLKLQGTTTDTATLRWRTNWYEIFVNNESLREQYTALGEDILAKQWNSEVFKGTTEPIIRFKAESEQSENVILEKESDINTVLGWSQYGNAVTTSTNYATRLVNLGSDTKYETKVIPYDEALKLLNSYNSKGGTEYTLEEWLTLSKGDDTGEVQWTSNISPYVPTEDKETDNEQWLEYVEKGLEPNTRYLILIRAYRGEDRTIKTYPSYVIATTTPKLEEVEPDPTTPILQLKKEDTTDESLTVYWKYNKNFDYEIRYSRLEDPESATQWQFKISDVVGDEDYILDGNGNAVVKITGLQPETTYNIWIRAKQKAGGKTSEWSNPVTGTTKSLEKPDPPRGLGKADYQSILSAGKDFKPVGKDYITVEWVRDPADEENQTSGKVYSYVIEMADNIEFLDAVSVNTASGGTAQNIEVLGKTLVRFNGLRANYPYYFRVKTVLSYRNQETGKEIVKESDFCNLVRVFTGTSSDEYDGGENPNIVIYPDPVEESYKDDVWLYNIVDAAKVTTQILQRKDYYYTITMNNYKNKYDAVTRSVKMPVKVLQTISNQGMVLRVQTNIGTYDIPGQALESYMSQFEGTDTVQFNLTRKSSSDIVTYVRSYPEQYQSGELLEIALRSGQKTTRAKTLDQEMTVKLKTDVTGAYNYTNCFTYQYNYDTGNWDTYKYQVDATDNKLLCYSTNYTGLNALYVRKVDNGTSSSSYLMNALASQYNITGLGTTYTANKSVNSAQYVKLMLGIAQNSKSIDLASAGTQEDYQKASAAGFYVSMVRGNVTREQALAGVVKLYEIKHGNKIKPSNMRFNGVSTSYSDAVSKAYAVGLIENMNSPQSNVKYSELCDWIALAID